MTPAHKTIFSASNVLSKSNYVEEMRGGRGGGQVEFGRWWVDETLKNHRMTVMHKVLQH